MDIKSKNYSKYKGINILLFILCVVLFIGALVMGSFAVKGFWELSNGGITVDDILYATEYKDSQAWQREFEFKVYRLVDLVNELPRGGEEVPKYNGFYYYVTDEVFAVTNLQGFNRESIVDGKTFEKLGKSGGYLIYEDGEMKKYPKSESSKNQLVKDGDSFLELHFQYLEKPDSKIYFAFDDSFVAEKEAAFVQGRDMVKKWIVPTGVAALLALFFLILLFVMTGKKDKEGNRPFHRIDRTFSEISLAIVLACFFGGGFLFMDILYDGIRYGQKYGQYDFDMLAGLALATVLGLAVASVGLLFLLSMVRNLKAGRFIKNSAIYLLVAAIIKGIVAVYRGGSLMRKIVIITLAVCLLSATVFLAPVAAVLILIFAPRWVRKYEAIRTGVNEVKNGNLTYKIPLSGDGELESLAADINEISEASHLAVQNELKNQRLKADLISNVSHDLKTPLTSIITYVDLLKTEGLDSEDAPQYLDILDQKSQRLQKLTEDLFDAAKASSGAIPVTFETVDMLSLINQGLGEMAGQIEASGLEFIINAEKEKYPVTADGQLLWRVVENLLGNVLKYAAEGSRVYIDLTEIAGINGNKEQVVLEMKNVSKSGLNISPDELMERFKRGDESRSSEGSGLGLAIAKDLVILQNGWFEIKIDGDLFKAIVMLAKAEDNDGVKTED